MKHAPRILALAALAIPLAACDTINSTEPIDTVNKPNIIRDKRIITDGFADANARVVSVNTATLPGDILKVQVTLHNATPFDQRMTYKFEWYDANAMIIETPLSVWQVKVLQGRETVNITSVAPIPQAKDFKLKLQESRHN